MAYSDKDWRYILLGLRITGEFGAIIAVPVVLLAMLGKYLDGLYGTRPMFLVGGFIVAFVLSAVSINRRAKKFRDEFLAIEPEPIDKKQDGEDGGVSDPKHETSS